MTGFMHTLAAFLVVLAPLIVIHEFGHYWVARRAGVKILRFSVGFGPTLWSRMVGADRTEFVIAGIPLGGYVKMLDEREAPVEPNELDREFNRKPLVARSAIVVAGPLANLLLAVAAFWCMFIIGVPGLVPVIGDVIPDSPAARSGLHPGDRITEVQGTSIATMESFKHTSIPALLSGNQVAMKVEGSNGAQRDVVLSGVEINADELAQGNIIDKLGIKPIRQKLPAVIDEVFPGRPAASSGLSAGDEVIAAEGKPVTSWEEWVDLVQARPEVLIHFQVRRGSQIVDLKVRPERDHEGQKEVGRIGAKPRIPPLDPKLEAVERFNPIAALPRALGETWDTTWVTVKFLAKMVSGQASVKNLGGPISIAQSAGATAKMGLAIFLSYVAVISVSLGVLNLLPIPILDGGLLMYYLIELVTGRPVSLAAQQAGQQVGIIILGLVMSLAFYNDIVRVLS